MIFVDTGAWFALVVPTDPEHKTASTWFAANREPVITSNYVVDETLTLLRARGEHRRAIAMGRLFFTGRIARVHHLSEEEVMEGWRIFEGFSDKAWSFTECTSKYLIEQLGMARAFAFNGHFRQFGSVSVCP